MNRLLWAALLASLALTGCDKKKAPNTPTPKTSVAQTNEAMHAVAEAFPASDPSLPSAATALAAQDADSTTAVR